MRQQDCARSEKNNSRVAHFRVHKLIHSNENKSFYIKDLKKFTLDVQNMILIKIVIIVSNS